MSVVYNYEIGVDTGASVVNLTLLQQQIMDSGLSSGAKADFESMNTGGGFLDIQFANAINGGDKNTLDAVVAAHMGEDLTETTQRAVDFSDDTPNSGTWANSLSLQAPMLSPGSWLIIIKCELQLTTGAEFTLGSPTNYPNRACEARVRIDGVDRVRWLSPWNNWHAVAAMDVLDLVAGATPLVELDFRLLGSGDSAEIRRRIINVNFIGGAENGEE